MDPTATLMEIRSIIAESGSEAQMAKPLQELEDEFHRLCELMDALDNWISSGGFLPEDWQKPVSAVGGKISG